MIKIITGVPGAGKTLYAVSLIVEARASGRNVYVAGLDGIDPSLGCLPFDPNAWESLPDGSLCVIDEAQKWWPTRMRGDPIPPVKALSEHRHRGFDFVLITQKPTMLDSWVRGLCGEHSHVERKFGTHVAGIRTWAECIEDTSSSSQREKAVVKVWRYPAELFQRYKSATIHTHKARLPARFWIVVACLLFIPLAVWGYMRSVDDLQAGALGHEFAEVEPARADAQRPAALSPPRERSERTPMTAEEYVAAITPRVPGMPWSAPIFDGSKPTELPRIACIMAARTCRCYTEQATPIFGLKFDTCATIARFGVYRPEFGRGT